MFLLFSKLSKHCIWPQVNYKSKLKLNLNENYDNYLIWVKMYAYYVLN